MAALQLFIQIDAFWPLRSRTHVLYVAIETENVHAGLKGFSALDIDDAGEKRKDVEEIEMLNWF